MMKYGTKPTVGYTLAGREEKGNFVLKISSEKFN